MMALDSARNTQVVQSKRNLYEIQPQADNSSFFTPLIFFIFVFVFYICMHLFCNRRFPIFLSGLDGLLFFSTGLLGVLLIFMWVGTDHSMTKNNYNLLWAWPTHLIVSFMISSRAKLVKKYFLVSAIGTSIVLMAWFFLPQQMNNALLPLVALIIWRSWVRYSKEF